mgnify:CR=1 FL=1
MVKKLAGIIVVAALFMFICNPGAEVAGVFTPSSIDKIQVISNNLNLRTGAGTNHKIITTLHRGDVMEVLGKINGWYVVKLSNDTVGCVIDDYVKQYVPKPVVTNPTPKPTPTPQPTPTPNPTPTPGNGSTVNASAMQAEMLGYINEARAQAGLHPLKLDAKLSEGATLKSRDMATNNYFSHQSPTYGSPFEMMRSLGITYRYAGENIAKHMSVKSAHDGFMNSPGHRANILGQNYNKVGLGFVKQGNYLYVTQWFTD